MDFLFSPQMQKATKSSLAQYLELDGKNMQQ